MPLGRKEMCGLVEKGFFDSKLTKQAFHCTITRQCGVAQ